VIIATATATGYCMKCKAQREIKNAKQITMKNGLCPLQFVRLVLDGCLVGRSTVVSTTLRPHRVMASGHWSR
jgi:hypothetical protein